MFIRQFLVTSISPLQCWQPEKFPSNDPNHLKKKHGTHAKGLGARQ